jgi:hypothetical protein
MPTYLIPLVVHLFIFTFVHATTLLNPSTTAATFTLNTQTIAHLKDIKNLTLIVDGKEIEYTTQSYIPSSHGSIRWVGKSIIYDSTFSFTFMKNALIGKILLNHKHYTLASLGQNTVVYQITLDDTKKEVHVCQKKNYIAQTKMEKYSLSNKIQSLSKALPIDALAATTKINVLILYTQQFLNHYGDNTDLTIQHYVDSANEIYTNSKTNVYLNLVHAQLNSKNIFSETHTISTVLPSLQSDTDVRALKQKYHADVVSLFRKYNGDSGTCGLGYLLNNVESTNYFYTTIEIKSANEGTGSYCPDRTFAHEIGHNFGCAHDRNHANVYPDNNYGYGYDVSGEFATVMSYDAFAIPYFSNPNLQYNGIDIGQVDLADCARNIREKRIYVKQSSALEINDTVTNNAITGLLTTIGDEDSFSFKLQGEISFDLGSNPTYYVHIYDSDGYLSKTSNSTFIHNFTDDTYTITASLKSADSSTSYQTTNAPYHITLTTVSGTVSHIPFTNKHEAFIERFYQNILARTADVDGLNYWLDILKNKSAARVVIGFFHSNEFTALGLNNSAYIDILYHTLFDRAPDIAGKSEWLNDLENGKSRDQVMFGFLNSQEFKNLADKFQTLAIRPIDQVEGLSGYVNRFYTLVLNREADQGGFDYWTNALISKEKAGGDIAKGFFNSTEYLNRGLVNNTFLDICYRAFFGREADSTGKSNWLNLLNKGTSKNAVLDGFIGSQEFLNLTKSFGILP